MVSPKPQRRIFLDSSVLYAAAFSATGPARRLILKGLQERVTLCISDLVIAETQRNLAKNAPEALPYFLSIVDLLSSQTTHSTKAEVLKAAQIVHLKDAAIVAAAAKGKVDYLATHDVKHLLTHANLAVRRSGESNSSSSSGSGESTAHSPGCAAKPAQPGERNPRVLAASQFISTAAWYFRQRRGWVYQASPRHVPLS